MSIPAVTGLEAGNHAGMGTRPSSTCKVRHLAVHIAVNVPLPPSIPHYSVSFTATCGPLDRWNELANMNIAWLFIKELQIGKSPTNYTSLSRQWDKRHKHSNTYEPSLGESYGSRGGTALSVYKSNYQTPSQWVNVIPREQQEGMKNSCAEVFSTI